MDTELVVIELPKLTVDEYADIMASLNMCIGLSIVHGSRLYKLKDKLNTQRHIIKVKI